MDFGIVNNHLLPKKSDRTNGVQKNFGGAVKICFFK